VSTTRARLFTRRYFRDKLRRRNKVGFVDKLLDVGQTPCVRAIRADQFRSIRVRFRTEYERYTGRVNGRRATDTIQFVRLVRSVVFHPTRVVLSDDSSSRLIPSQRRMPEIFNERLRRSYYAKIKR